MEQQPDRRDPGEAARRPGHRELGELEQRSAGAARAKTGLLTRVTGLSGFARRPDGEVVVFSVLVNGYRGDDRSAMDALDAFVAALANTPAPLADTAPAL